MSGSIAALIGALASALIAGCAGGVLLLKGQRERKRRRAVRNLASGALSTFDAGEAESTAVTGLARSVLLCLRRESRRERVGASRSSLLLAARFDPQDELLAHAGLLGAVTVGGVRAGRFRLAAGGLAAGAVIGAIFTWELALLCATVGLCLGFHLPAWALKKEALMRGQAVECHLSEMVEVIMLGLRSGLSFERSFALYPQYFDNVLAQSVQHAIGEWETGLVQREEALRNLSAQYDSVLLERVVENAIRSLRFGSPLADALESSAVEARALHKARVEERIAKAPVKMMLPVGTLILPAMLLLVVGPVILELMTEF